eukprot:2170553-Rhodomonas_salina.3
MTGTLSRQVLDSVPGDPTSTGLSTTADLLLPLLLPPADDRLAGTSVTCNASRRSASNASSLPREHSPSRQKKTKFAPGARAQLSHI